MMVVYVLILCFIGLSSTILTGGTGEDTELTFMQHYQKGMEAHAKKDYAGFLKHMEKAVALRPQSNDLKFLRARSYAVNGKTSEATKALNRLVDMGLLYNIETEKDFDGLRKEKSFQALMEKLKAKNKPINNSTVAFTIAEKDLIPEGIAYDPVENAFYLSSLNKHKVVRIDARGSVSDYIESRRDGLLPTVGMRVDAKRRVLWVCSGFGSPRADLDKSLMGSSGVFKYDLKTGKLIKKYMVPQKENHFLNDVALTPDGTVYISDSHVAGVYRIDSKIDKIERFLDFKDYMYPNGITYSPDTDKIFVACVDFVVAVDVKSKTISPLAHPGNIHISGSDGFYYYKNSLIGVQNSVTPVRVVRMQLDEKQMQVIGFKTLESNHPDFSVPTTGAIVGDSLYLIAASQLHRFDKTGKIAPLEQLIETKILKIKLD
jgi:sugar lactone lactonase YvrE